MDFLCIRWVKPVRQSPRMEMYGFFTHGTAPPLHLYSLVFFLFPTTFANRLPQPIPLPIIRSRGFHRASLVLFGCPTTGRAPLATSLPLIGLLPAEPPADPASSPGVTTLFFRTVPSANTLVRWVNENAFVSIVQTRPCHTFGRPVHHFRLRPGTSPHALRIPPHDGHPALRKFQEDGFRSALAVSDFRLRAQLDFSIPTFFPGQRGITPAFGYSAPHPSARGTLTLLNNALPSAHYGFICRPSVHNVNITVALR